MSDLQTTPQIPNIDQLKVDGWCLCKKSQANEIVLYQHLKKCLEATLYLKAKVLDNNSSVKQCWELFRCCLY